MDSGFFIPHGAPGGTPTLRALVRFLCWLNEHVRSLIAAGHDTRTPLDTRAHLEAHTCGKNTWTKCHRPSGPRTDRRGRWEEAVVPYGIAAGDCLDHNSISHNPLGPKHSHCSCHLFTGLPLASSLRTQSRAPGVWERQMTLLGHVLVHITESLARIKKKIKPAIFVILMCADLHAGHGVTIKPLNSRACRSL